MGGGVGGGPTGDKEVLWTKWNDRGMGPWVMKCGGGVRCRCRCRCVCVHGGEEDAEV